MIRIQKYLIVIFLFCPVIVMGQDADFEIRNFRERTNDLSAISSNYRDLNGKPAALIRFVVRDTKFEFEANLGIIAMKRKTGEVYLYVPQDTRRLTVRHPSLGVLKDYTIPMKIRSKVTYDADIVITRTNLSEQGPYDIGSYEQPAPSNQPVTTIQPIPQPINKNEYDHPAFHVYAGLGFNALSVMGPSLHLGFGYKSLYLEGGYVFGIDKVKDVNLTLGGQSDISESYDYSASKIWIRLGYKIGIQNSNFYIEPQAGVSFNMINGKSKISSTTEYLKKSTPMSIFGGLRFSYEITKGLYVHVTPQYDFALSGDDIYPIIKTADNKINSWGEGFGLNAGLLYYF